MDIQWLAVGGLAVGAGLMHLRGLMARGQFIPAFHHREVREGLAELRGALREGSSRPLGDRSLQTLARGLLSEVESGLPLRGVAEFRGWQAGLRVAALRSMGGPLEYDFTRALRATEEVEQALARVVTPYP